MLDAYLKNRDFLLGICHFLEVSQLPFQQMGLQIAWGLFHNFLPFSTSFILFCSLLALLYFLNDSKLCIHICSVLVLFCLRSIQCTYVQLAQMNHQQYISGENANYVQYFQLNEITATIQWFCSHWNNYVIAMKTIASQNAKWVTAFHNVYMLF